jgi:hypothetical protein
VSIRDYFAISLAVWLWLSAARLWLHILTGRRCELLELAALLLFWPLVAAAALIIALACGAAWLRERIIKLLRNRKGKDHGEINNG